MTSEKSFPFLETPARTSDGNGLFDYSPVSGKKETTKGEPIEVVYSWYELYGSVIKSLNPNADMKIRPFRTDTSSVEQTPHTEVYYAVIVEGVDEELFTQALCERLTNILE